MGDEPSIAGLEDIARRWATFSRENTKERDQAIRVLRAAGVPYRRIAEVTGLGLGTVVNICKRKAETTSEEA